MGYNLVAASCSAVTDDGGPEIWIFQCPALLHLNPSYLCSPDTELLLSGPVPWRVPPIGISTVYELLHRDGSQYPWQQ